MQAKRGDAVLIEWVDSRGRFEGWEMLDELESLPTQPCFSMGFVLEDKPQYVTICQTDGGDQVLSRLSIPRRAIVRASRLALPSFAVGRLREVGSGHAPNVL